jgi:hypothetical protein
MIMRPEKVTGEHLDPCLVQMDYLYHLSASSPWKHIVCKRVITLIHVRINVMIPNSFGLYEGYIVIYS